MQHRVAHASAEPGVSFVANESLIFYLDVSGDPTKVARFGLTGPSGEYSWFFAAFAGLTGFPEEVDHRDGPGVYQLSAMFVGAGPVMAFWVIALDFPNWTGEA